MNNINQIETVKNKMEELGFDLNQTVYLLTYEDIACVIADFVEPERFEKLTDRQLHEMVGRVRRSLEALEWYEAGENAVTDVLDEIEREGM